MARIKLLMASVTALVWEARSCHIGGSLGLIARFLAEVSRLLLDRLTFLPAIMMGSWAWRALALILAGVEANWGAGGEGGEGLHSLHQGSGGLGTRLAVGVTQVTSKGLQLGRGEDRVRVYTRNSLGVHKKNNKSPHVQRLVRNKDH